MYKTIPVYNGDPEHSLSTLFMFLMGVNFSKYFDLLDTSSVKINMCVLLWNSFFRCDLFWLQNQLNYEYTVKI